MNLEYFKAEQNWPKIICAGLALMIWGPFLLFGPYGFFQLGDTGEELIPYLISSVTTDGGPPYWNPYLQGGLDWLSQSVSFAFGNILFGHLPTWLGYQILLGLTALAGGYSVYSLCHHKFSFERWSSILVAIALAGFFTGQGQIFGGGWCIALASIWALSKAFEQDNLILAIIVGLIMGVAMASAAAVIFVVPHSMVFVVTWFIFADTRKKPTEWAVILLYCLVIVAWTYLDVWAITANSFMSSASSEPYPGWGALRLISNSFINKATTPRDAIFLFSFILVLGSFFIGSWKDKNFRGLVFALIFVYASVFLGIVIQVLLSEQFPFLKGYSVERLQRSADIFLLFSACGALTTIYRHYSDNGPSMPRRFLIAFCLVALAVTMYTGSRYYILGLQWAKRGNYIAFYKSPTLKELAKKSGGKLGQHRVSGVGFADSILSLYRIETLSGDMNITFDHAAKYWEALHTKPNNGNPKAQGLADGLTYLSLECHISKQTGIVNLQECINLDMLALGNTRYLISLFELQHPGIEKISGPDKPWMSLSSLEKLKVTLPQNIYGRSHLNIYQLRDWAPRAFITEGVKSFANINDLYLALSNGTLESFRKEAYVLESDYTGPFHHGNDGGKITHFEMTSDKVLVKVAENSSGILVISNVYSPYWKAVSGDKPLKIFPVYGNFWGISITPGINTIEITYAPPYS